MMTERPEVFSLDKNVLKIVITGGPCGGKSTAIERVKAEFENLGYRVLLVQETATELIRGGVAPWTCRSNADYQSIQMSMQLQKERIFEEAAEIMKENRILIVCDRGLIDNKVYMSNEEFLGVMLRLGVNEVELRDNYDAVFHLVTAANGAEQFYTTANNSARTETPQQAKELDEKLIDAWTGHPHLRVIGNKKSFEDKLNRLLEEIKLFAGIPEPVEIERKFLIHYPDIQKLEQMKKCQRTEIIQTYLHAPEGEEVRVRQRGADGNYTYSHTRKVKLGNMKRIEEEKRISRDEYLTYLMDADTRMRQIRKSRYCLVYKNKYFEIDIYPFWQDKAVMEIELLSENEQFEIPPFVDVIKEVTGDPEYKNSTLAKI